MEALVLEDKPAADKTAAVTYRQAPANVEAEQALLGAILVNNEALSRLGDRLKAEDFHEPLHRRIFEAIRKFNDRGLTASPVTLKHYFEQDEALADIGGGQYLVKLAAAAVHVLDVADFSGLLADLSMKRQLITVGEEMVNTAYNPDIDLAASELLENAEQKLFHLAAEGTGDKAFRALRHSVTEAVRRAEAAHKNAGKIVGVDTGLTDMNTMLGGMQRSDLLILAGRPSMGKTALATNIAYNAALSFVHESEALGISPREGKSVGFFSLEMSAEQLATRLLAAGCKFSSQKLTHGNLTRDDFDTLAVVSAEMARLPFHIDDTPALSIAALRSRARRLKRTHNLGLLVVDYLQLVRGHSTRAEAGRVQEVSEITQGLKAIAKELDIPLVALSQLSRAVEQREDKRPLLSDLRESGSIEQDADVVMFIYREEYYEERKMPSQDDAEKMTQWQASMERVHGVAEVIVAKHRNGPVGTVRLHFNAPITQFGNLAQDHVAHRGH